VRKDVAMTGEITLRGRVLPIGGLKEKLLAALRGGIKTVLIPQENVKDLQDIPDNVKRNLEIIPVATVDDVLKNALSSPVKPIEWDPDASVEAVGPAKPEGDLSVRPIDRTRTKSGSVRKACRYASAWQKCRESLGSGVDCRRI
jgi:ATP-dependent Lon protease